MSTMDARGPQARRTTERVNMVLIARMSCVESHHLGRSPGQVGLEASWGEGLGSGDKCIFDGSATWSITWRGVRMGFGGSSTWRVPHRKPTFSRLVLRDGEVGLGGVGLTDGEGSCPWQFSPAPGVLLPIFRSPGELRRPTGGHLGLPRWDPGGAASLSVSEVADGVEGSWLGSGSSHVQPGVQGVLGGRMEGGVLGKSQHHCVSL